jgi:transposase
MPRPYSGDLRARVIEDISTGASRREAAERYGVSASVVVLWAQRFERTGNVAAKPSGGSTSPLEEHADFLLDLIVEQPDLTLDEVVAAMKKRRILAAAVRFGASSIDATSASKKTLYAVEQKRAEAARQRRRGCDSRACLTRLGWCSSTKPARIPAWCGYAGAVRAASG